jgi:hypothetical protein
VTDLGPLAGHKVVISGPSLKVDDS